MATAGQTRLARKGHTHGEGLGRLIWHMDASRAFKLRAGLVAAGTSAVVLMLGSAASAQTGSGLVPPISTSLLPSVPVSVDTGGLLPTGGSVGDDGLSVGPEDLVPTPLQTDTVTDLVDQVEGTVTDTVGTISETLDGVVDGDDDSGDGGTGGEGGGGGGDGGNGGGNGGGGEGGGDGGSGGSGGTGDGARGTGPSGGGSAGGGDGGATAAGVHTSYGSIAARSAIAAAGRLLRLAAPLAAPLVLGGVALIGLLMLGRGSNKLLKLDAFRAPTKTFRL